MPSPPRLKPSWRPPLHKVLTSMPGIGVRTCARILTEVTGKHFASAAHLASYAGIAPVGAGTRNSNAHCSSPPSRRCTTRRHGLTTTANGPKANATTRPSSPSHAAVQTSSSPCSETEPSTRTRNNETYPQRLDENHSGTPLLTGSRARWARVSRGLCACTGTCIAGLGSGPRFLPLLV
jgi:hypothetical protein